MLQISAKRVALAGLKGLGKWMQMKVPPAMLPLTYHQHLIHYERSRL